MKLWKQSVEELRSWMKEHEGNLTLCNMVCEYLLAWQSQTPYPSTQSMDSILRKAIIDQDRIGLQSFLEGYWSNDWKIRQQEHLESINSRKSSTYGSQKHKGKFGK